MIGFIMVGTNNLETSSRFYDIILSTIGLSKTLVTERYIGYADKNTKDKIEFYITKPVNKESASYGNGTQISFLVDSRVLVDEFYNIALENGAKSEGGPGARDPNNTSYYAYFRDLDGNKICAYSENI
jgi:catechol 2,3-dioxygenase-like lactoylglutathione lyase family enzyme